MKSWTSYDWSDITPVPYQAGEPALASIAYTAEYQHVMGYFRPLLAQREISERALALIAQVIELNPAHYSAWDYRFDVVKEIGNKVFDYTKVGLVTDKEPAVGENGDWINEVTISNPKNYQVWNYRQHLETPGNSQYYVTELQIVNMVLDDDPKNFHAWSHLKWVVGQANKHNDPCQALEDLLKVLERRINEDIYNNSCWSFRYFLFEINPQVLSDEDNFKKEVKYTQEKIDAAPTNQSSWSYLKGIYDKYNQDQEELAAFAVSKINQSTRGIEIAADIYAKIPEKAGQSAKYYSILSQLEPVRRGLWEYKKQLIQNAQS